MPKILSYIVQGYVFLTAYYWISFKDNKDFKNLIIKSIAVSYILKILFDKICEWKNIVFKNDINYAICLIGSSAILGFLLGKLLSHRWFNLLLHKFHIGRTTNENIWDDVIKPYTWVCVHMKDGTSYLGQYRYGEPFKSEPIIVLATYQKLDQDNDVVIDNSQDLNRVIVLNTKNFEKIEVIYNQSSDKLWNKIEKRFKIEKRMKHTKETDSK